MKKINYWNILNYIFYFLVVIFAILAISSKYSIGGYKLLIVRSGSMEPEIKKGSVVITKTNSTYQVGDIVTYVISNENNSITHRIVEISNEKGQVYYKTKGDANPAVDTAKISKSQIIGKFIFTISYLGYIINFSRTLPGLIILIIIPITIIIYEELKNIKSELKKRKTTHL